MDNLAILVKLVIAACGVIVSAETYLTYARQLGPL